MTYRISASAVERDSRTKRLGTDEPQCVPAMAGANAFLGTNVFKAFRSALLKAAEEIAGYPPSELREILAVVTDESLSLLDRIEAAPAQQTQEAIDSASNLLYFASGAAWHAVAMHESCVLPPPTGLMSVEPFEQLCRLCMWTEHTHSPSDALIAASRLLRNLPER